MTESKYHIDTTARNIGVVIIAIGVILLIIWLCFFWIFPKVNFLILLFLGIGLFLGGLMFVTRIQFAIWLEQRVFRKKKK